VQIEKNERIFIGPNVHDLPNKSVPAPLALVLFQDDYFLSGEYQYVLGWKQKLEEEGFRVDYFSPVGKGLRGEGFKKNRRGESPLCKALEIIPFVFRVRRLLLSGRWEAIHLFLPSASFLWMSRFFPKRSRSKNLYITCLGERPHVGLLHFFSTPIKDWPFLFIRLLLRMAPRGSFDGAGYFVGTHGERNRLIADGCSPEKVRVVLPPLVHEGPADLFSISLAKSMGRKRSIIYIGHFLPPKGVGDLLKAFSQLKESDAHLVLSWSGLGDVQEILQMAENLKFKDRIEITDRIVHKGEILKAAVGLVLPFRSTFGQVSPPLVLLEAFRVGIPTIVPAWPTWTDICIQDRTSFCYPPLEVKGLASAMEKLLGCSFEEREGMRRNQRELMNAMSVRTGQKSL
jgi:glycosyltransferase involved in cell wall biosynthesis